MCILILYALFKKECDGAGKNFQKTFIFCVHLFIGGFRTILEPHRLCLYIYIYK